MTLPFAPCKCGALIINPSAWPYLSLWQQKAASVLISRLKIKKGPLVQLSFRARGVIALLAASHGDLVATRTAFPNMSRQHCFHMGQEGQKNLLAIWDVNES